MGQKNNIATLGITLEMTTADAVANITRFGGVVDKTMQAAVNASNQAEAAVKQLGDTTAPAAGMASLAKVVRDAAAARREYNQAERAGEGMAARLDREIASYGKTTAELRSVKAETAALNAERQGQIELAERIRAKEAELYAMEFAAARQARQEADALAEDRALAAATASAAAEREAMAIREATQAHQMFEAAVRQGAAALREQEAAQKATDLEVQAVATRNAAVAHQMFEARVREGAAAMRAEEAAAVADAAALQRIRELLDPAAAAQDRLNKEMAEAQRVMLAAGLSGEQVARVQALIAQGATHVVGSTGNMKAGMQQLSYQLNDAATMWSLQAPVMQIFASQAGQVTQAVQLMAGESKGFLSILGGPWGLAFTTAAVVLVPVIGHMLKFSTAVDDATDRLKKQGIEADVTRQAQERYRLTAEGVADAIRDGTEATRKSIEAMRPSADAANIEAKNNLLREVAIRKVTTALLEQAIVEAEAQKTRAQAVGDRGDMAALAANEAVERVAALRMTLAEQEDLIGQAEKRVQFTRIELAVEAAKRASDPIERIKRLYDDQATAAKLAAVAQVEAGKEVGVALTLQLAAIERNRAAAVKAEQDKLAAATATANQIGRTVTLAEARGIAESVGGRVTSDHRTFAEQQRLYDKYMAYKAGDGPWAALAARPGTSNHELDQALDVAKSDGVTLKKLIDAYRGAGVKLVEALDEGSHFHIAWKKTGAAAQEAREAAKAVDEATKFQAGAADRMAERTGELHLEVQKLMAGWGNPVDTMGKDINVDRSIDRSTDALSKWLEFHGPLAEMNKQLEDQAKLWDDIGKRVEESAANMRDAFGSVGGAIGDVSKVLAEYGKRQADLDEQKRLAGGDQDKIDRAAKQSADLQLSSLLGITNAAKGLFREHSAGYKAMEAAEKALTLIQLARTAVDVAGGAARMFAELGPWAFPAVAAMLGVMASLGFSGGGSSGKLPETNKGTGTVLGNPDDKSESLLRSIDLLRDIDDATLTVSRGMLNSLRSIEDNIGGLATLLVRAGNINASAGVNEGFSTDTTGKALAFLATGGAIGAVLKNVPILGDILGGIGGVVKSLFGTKTTVVGSGLYGDAQTVGDILGGGFDADYYSDIKKKKKFFGISAGTKYSTKYTDADAGIEDQFALLIRQFYETIGAAAEPLGQSLDAVQQRLLGFTVNIGKIDLTGLSGDEIQEKLSAVFGAAADSMAEAAVPGLSRFQKVGEGAFETLVRVASTVEQVDAAFQRLGVTSGTLGVDIDMAVAGMFDSVSDFTSAADAYFAAYYSDAERAAAETARMGKAFDALGLAMPGTLAGFRALVEAQDLTTTAGQEMYATLLQLAPAFADLKGSLDGAASAAAIVRERQDLEKQLLELQGDTVALRAAELAKLDPSNRALQEQIYAIQDAQKAADAAAQLREAWKSVGDTILEEVKRIRGLSDTSGDGSFASLMGQFNVANSAARAGDMDAAKSLPQLSKSLLDAAALAATSRQELDRVQAQTAAMLESTYAVVNGLAGSSTAASTADVASAAAAATSATASPGSDEAAELRKEVAALRTDLIAALAQIAGNTGRSAKTLENVTAASGGDAISVTSAAA